MAEALRVLLSMKGKLMFATRSLFQLAAGVVTSALLLATPLQSMAEPGLYTSRANLQSADASSVACERAKLSAWYQRQRELTDGDADPLKPLSTPTECKSSMGASAKAAEKSASYQDTSAMGK